MLRKMSSNQLSEWIAFYRLEPFGYRAVLFGFCIVAATLININSGKNKKIEAHELLDMYAPEVDGRRANRVDGRKLFEYLSRFAVRKKNGR